MKCRTNVDLSSFSVHSYDPWTEFTTGQTPFLWSWSKLLTDEIIHKFCLYSSCNQEAKSVIFDIQSTSLITTLGGASEKCPYSRSVVIPKVSLYVSQLDGTLLWA